MPDQDLTSKSLYEMSSNIGDRSKFAIDYYTLIFTCGLILLAIINPFLAVLYTIFLSGSRFAFVIDNTVYILLLAFSVALVVSTRSIPVFPFDDLTDYWRWYKLSQNLSFVEIIVEFRYEPILYWIYAYLLPDFSEPRSLLVVNSWLSSTAYFFAARAMRKYYGLPMWSIALFLAAFPYEIVSNIHRQMLATFIMLWVFFAKKDNKIFYVIISIATHKSLIALALFRAIPFSRVLSIPIFVTSVLIAIFGFYIIELFISLGLGGRLVSFFLREAASKNLIYFCFVVLSATYMFFPTCRRQYVAFIYIICAALMLSDQGPLGIRLAYYVYLPTLVGLVMLGNKFKFSYSSPILVFLFSLVYTVRMFFLVVENTHDPFSEYSVLESFFYILKIF